VRTQPCGVNNPLNGDRYRRAGALTDARGQQNPHLMKRENDQPSIFLMVAVFLFLSGFFLFLLCKGGTLGVGFVSSFSFVLA
jgi:hypothetical protein